MGAFRRTVMAEMRRRRRAPGDPAESRWPMGPKEPVVDTTLQQEETDCQLATNIGDGWMSVAYVLVSLACLAVLFCFSACVCSLVADSVGITVNMYDQWSVRLLVSFKSMSVLLAVLCATAICVDRDILVRDVLGRREGLLFGFWKYNAVAVVILVPILMWVAL